MVVLTRVALVRKLNTAPPYAVPLPEVEAEAVAMVELMIDRGPSVLSTAPPNALPLPVAEAEASGQAAGLGCEASS